MENNKNILLIDDDAEALKVVVSIFEKNTTYNIYQALSVDYALKISNSRQLDLVISDWEMPKKSGIDLIESFKKNEKTRKIPIIIVSGVLVKPEDLELAFDTGAIDYLRKPIEPIELISRVKSIFKIKEYQDALIEQKNNELALHALYLLENKKKQVSFFENLQEIVKKISLGKTQAFCFIEKITLEMRGNLKRDVWADFEFYFNQMHPDFTKRLSKKIPGLSASEIRLCGFIRMNMSSQSIANVLHNNVNSVKTARTRLRTKLKLTRKDNLTAFISSI